MNGEPQPSELSVPNLALPEQIVIWSLRRYVAGDGRSEALAPMFRRIFGLAGVEEALTAFAALMTALQCRARRPVRIKPLATRRLSADEACILRLTAAQQRADDGTAAAVAAWLMTAPAIDELLLASRRFALALAARQHRVAPPPGGDRPIAAPIAQLPPTQAVAELETAEAILLRGIRLWVERFKKRECGLWDLDRHFMAHGLGEATPSLHALLFNSSVATLRSLDVRCARCPSLSPDEARMLHAVACLQARDETAAAAALSSWLPPAAVRLTIEAVRGLADSLTAERVRLPVRRWRFLEPRESRGAYAAATVRPAGLLH